MTEARLRVRVTPHAAHDEIVNWVGGAQGHPPLLRVRIRAPAVKGQANAALLCFLARRLGVPQSALRIVAGATAREKVIAIDGLLLDEVQRRLEPQ